MKEKIKSILLADYPRLLLGLLAIIPIMCGYVFAVIFGNHLYNIGWNLILCGIVAAVLGSIPYILVLVWLMYRKNNGKSH